MQKKRHGVVVLLVTLGISILRATAPAIAVDKPDKLRIAYITTSGSMATLWVAAAASAFQNEGLDVELVYIQASAAIAAVLAGEVGPGGVFAPGNCPAVSRGWR